MGQNTWRRYYQRAGGQEMGKSDKAEKTAGGIPQGQMSASLPPWPVVVMDEQEAHPDPSSGLTSVMVSTSPDLNLDLTLKLTGFCWPPPTA